MELFLITALFMNLVQGITHAFTISLDSKNLNQNVESVVQDSDELSARNQNRISNSPSGE